MVYNCMQRCRSRVHVVPLRLTHDEWRLIAEIAHLRGVTVEDLVREGLRLSRLDGSGARPRRGRLRVVAPSAPREDGAGR